uniref:Integral membrane protein n=1 Tax=Moniliophthora roreri TaxID=221103 RepID=A0A0W0F8J3_MONRR
MVNWADPIQIQRVAVALDRVIFCVLGVVMWELFITCDFEWSIITRRRPFRWPLVSRLPNTLKCFADPVFQVFFFFSRYCIVMALTGLIVSVTVTSELNCGALYTFISWAGNMTMLCASTSLMLRTIALWERKLIVVIPLGVLCIAFWTILYRTMFIVRAQWDDSISACAVVQTNPSLLNVTFFFTMGFDFVILAYTFVALTARHTARTDLWKLLFQDGLVYFVVTFSANCIPAVSFQYPQFKHSNERVSVPLIFSLLAPKPDYDPKPSLRIATVPAAAVSSIASCRAVMRLLQYKTADVYVHSMSGVPGATSTANTNQPRQGSLAYSLSVSSPKFTLTRPEVHVTTEHITMTEFRGNEGQHSDTKPRTSLDVDLEAGKGSGNLYTSA